MPVVSHSSPVCRARGWPVGGALLLAAACQGPAVELTATEADATIVVDGVAVGRGHAMLPHRYYGTMAVAALPVRHDEREEVRTGAFAKAELPPPAPRWLFPFDLLLEAWQRGLRPAEATRIEIAVPAPQARFSPDAAPPDLEALLARGRAVRTER